MQHCGGSSCEGFQRFLHSYVCTNLTAGRPRSVTTSCTFCLGWLGDDTTTVLQMVRATKKSMMSARSEGSWVTGWLWKRMKSI